MAPKLKKLDDNDKYSAIKAKKEKEELTQKPVVVTKAKTKGKPMGQTAKKMKATLDSFADKRKKES